MLGIRSLTMPVGSTRNACVSVGLPHLRLNALHLSDSGGQRDST